MFKYLCNTCNKDIIVSHIQGTQPPHFPLKAYCSEACLTKKHEETIKNCSSSNESDGKIS
jgi:hypothetical protein